MVLLNINLHPDNIATKDLVIEFATNQFCTVIHSDPPECINRAFAGKNKHGQ